MKRTRLALVVLALFAGLLQLDARDHPDADAPRLTVASVDAVGVTVSDMTRALEFYTSVLPFERVSDVEVAGRQFELLTGVFGARARIVRLRLGDEYFDLTEYLAPRGRPIPPDVRSHDRIFQHAALIVRDMDAAYRRLREKGVRHASTGPQLLPAWNPNAGGIKAFYFRDPDGHFLELLEFPPGKGLAKWHRADPPLFLGIDHTAIVVGDTNASLRFYRDTLGLSIAGESENYDLEQERLNNVFGARLRITALRAGAGPGIELLEYLAPGDGRPAPTDLRANDIAHWETTLVAPSLEPLLPLARAHRIALVSPGGVDVSGVALPVAPRVGLGALTRDPDGHALRLVSPSR
jgi:catechol 2,3-dioxygenase-like lactoylglutathione lyase family enzyme